MAVARMLVYSGVQYVFRLSIAHAVIRSRSRRVEGSTWLLTKGELGIMTLRVNPISVSRVAACTVL
jgi:predicted thioredoxin/glutaredoxin